MSDGPPAAPGSAAPAAWPYAEVAVDVPLGGGKTGIADRRPARDATFHYAVPQALDGALAPGHLVWVPFGRRRVQGLVVALRRQSPVERLREIEALAAPRPLLTAETISLARWMNAHYLAPFFECLRAMLPPGQLTRYETRYRRTAQQPARALLTDDQLAVLGAFGRDRELSADDIERRSDVKHPGTALEALVAAGLLTAETRPTRPRVRAKHERVARLVVEDQAEIEARLRVLRQSKQADVVALLRGGTLTLPSPDVVCDQVDCTRGVLRALEERALITIHPAQRRVAATVSAAEAKALADDELARAPAQSALLQYLAAADGPVERDVALEAVGCSAGVLRALVERGHVREIEVSGGVGLNVRGVRAREAELQLRGVETHAALLDALAAHGGTASAAQLRQATDGRLKHLRELEEAGLIVLADRHVVRDPLAGRSFEPRPAPTLTDDQARAWSVIERGLGRGSWAGTRPAVSYPAQPPVYLVHGVTGSGKTELYLKAIEHVLFQGRQAIVLVPEIALTAQTIERFAGRFPDRIGVWHSQLSEGERFDTWHRARNGTLDVIIGSRSAVLAPLGRLGLVVIDEEHSDSYKQIQTPRYHARAVALQRAALSGAAVILGSATPAVESANAAERGAYRRLELPRRVVVQLPAADGADAGEATDVPFGDLPPVEIVDLRAELRAGNTSIFSRALQAALEDVLAEGAQAILFLNRRGSNTFVMCRDCGHVQDCPRCQLPLTYHGRGHHLVCHHCGHHTPPPMMCPSCGSSRIRYFGIGTQRVADAVRERLPEARVLRWDADTTRRKGQHEALLARFRGGGADVLVGTQMIAKGLDLPHVTLVGIVSADTALHLPDFRARERTFQLLSQVAGRAGRSSRGGRVILQTYNPDEPAIRAAAAHDYDAFYAKEIAFRKQQRYPPFRALVKLSYLTKRDTTAEKATAEVADRLRARIERLGLPETDVIGPAPAFFHRTRGRVRWQLVVRAADPHALLADMTFGPGWRVDVDPTDLL